MAKLSVKRAWGDPNTFIYQEAAAGLANAFYSGDLVKLDASGELVIAASGAILGIAGKTATGTASTEIPVDVLQPHDVLSIKYKASATVEALLGDCVDFTFTANGHTVDEAGATTDAVVIGFHDPVGTSGGRLFAQIIPAALQAGAAHS